MTANTLADGLRAYVETYGAKAALAIVAAICDETAKANPGKPVGTMASINANLITQAMGKMV